MLKDKHTRKLIITLFTWRGIGYAGECKIKIKRLLGDKSIAKVQIVIRSMESMYLYLTHESKDAVEKKKHKYSKHDIALLNNFDIDRYITLDVKDKDDMLNDVCDLIDDHNLANMRELRRFLKAHGSEYGMPSIKVVNSVLRCSYWTDKALFRCCLSGTQVWQRRYKQRDR